jgi:hypothetical protein
MNYAQYREKKYPIGSGMRWKEKGAGIILTLRALVLTKERWSQFWAKLDRYGFPVEPRLYHSSSTRGHTLSNHYLASESPKSNPISHPLSILLSRVRYKSLQSDRSGL